MCGPVVLIRVMSEHKLIAFRPHQAAAYQTGNEALIGVLREGLRAERTHLTLSLAGKGGGTIFLETIFFYVVPT